MWRVPGRHYYLFLDKKLFSVFDFYFSILSAVTLISCVLDRKQCFIIMSNVNIRHKSRDKSRELGSGTPPTFYG